MVTGRCVSRRDCGIYLACMDSRAKLTVVDA